MYTIWTFRIETWILSSICHHKSNRSDKITYVSAQPSKLLMFKQNHVSLLPLLICRTKTTVLFGYLEVKRIGKIMNSVNYITLLNTHEMGLAAVTLHYDKFKYKKHVSKWSHRVYHGKSSNHFLWRFFDKHILHTYLVYMTWKLVRLCLSYQFSDALYSIK
jgi:hypothetical protein